MSIMCMECGGGNEKELLASTMMFCGLATGHGDSFEDLIEEMKAQVLELQNRLAPQRVLMKSALTLAREVKGSFELFEPLARREIGNTNYKCIVDAAEAVIALAVSSAERS